MTLEEILDKIHQFYPPNPDLYKEDNFYKSSAGGKVYAAWESQDAEKTWDPFVAMLNEQTGLRLISIYRGSEFCFKAYGDFNEFSADKNIDTTIVVSVSTIIPFHSIYVSPARSDNPKRTFYDGQGNSLDFSDPCFSDECKQLFEFQRQALSRSGKSEPETKCSLTPDAIKIIETISDITGKQFSTTILPLDLINKRVNDIAVEDSFIGDVNIYTAAFTPHII